MKHIKFHSGLSALALFLALGLSNCAKDEQVTLAGESTNANIVTERNPNGPSASGQGKIANTDRVFAFNASTRSDGTVHGEGLLNRTGSGVRFKFDINCLSVSGNIATMSGIVTECTFPEAVGQPCLFRVKDNGEGQNADPDMITFMYYCDGNPECALPSCEEYVEQDPNNPLRPIDRGNIQVRN